MPALFRPEAVPFMHAFICIPGGSQYPPSETAPAIRAAERASLRRAFSRRGPCRTGGHGAAGRGVPLSPDIATVTVDRKLLSFMRGYPNLISLSQKQVYAIGAALAAVEIDTIYGQFFDRVIAGGGKDILARSIALCQRDQRRLRRECRAQGQRRRLN
jgi:hypothetical protein